MTFDYGVRFLLYSPRTAGPTTRSRTSIRRDTTPSQAPRLYYACDASAARASALDRDDRPDAEPDLHRRLRARDGQSRKRHGAADRSPACPKGSARSHAPQPEPRARLHVGSHRRRQDRRCTRARASSTTRASAADRAATSRPIRRSSQPDRRSTDRSSRSSRRASRCSNRPGTDGSARDRTTRRPALTTGRSACGARSAGARWWTRRTRAASARNLEMLLRPQRRCQTAPASLTRIRRTAIPTGECRPRVSADFLRPFLGYGSITRARELGTRATSTRCRCR